MGAVISIIRETQAGELRVSATPETVKKYVASGLKILVESGAGLGASITDQDFENAGALITTRDQALGEANIVLKVNGPERDEMSLYKPNTIVIAQMDAYMRKDMVAAMAQAGLTSYAMEFVPRITRAQSMDVLSSQANLAGYRCVIEAANHYGRAFPMMMTAAGTVAPAKVFVMGAGVAGLQAIATARRLGAVVTATDVRPATKEQVESLGAKFLAVEDEEFKNAQTAGGYAKEMSDAYKEKQAALTQSHIAKQDIVITTALIPGRKAPILVTSSMVDSMKQGSVLIDLAARQGGNVEGSKPDEVVIKNGVKIIGYSNILSTIAADASQLYAKNLFNFLSLIIDKEGNIMPPTDDEILTASRLTKDGVVVHPNLQGL